MKQVDIDIKSVQDKIEQNTKSKAFQTIYPFTTENCASYIKNLQVNNCSVLTVGSSADQVIHAAKDGAKDITVCDISPFTRYYYYLKKSAILQLSLAEFDLFLYTSPLDKHLFDKLTVHLETEDQESAIFWQTLLTEYDQTTLYKALFTRDVLTASTIKKVNSYLQNDQQYHLVREKIQDLHPTFIKGDILQANQYLTTQSYDRIILSNVSQYLEYFYPPHSDYHQAFFNAFLQLDDHLNENGIIQLAYLYSFAKSDIFQEDPFLAIQNFTQLYLTFSPYSLDIEWIDSVNEQYHKPDAIVTYTKHRK